MDHENGRTDQRARREALWQEPRKNSLVLNAAALNSTVCLSSDRGYTCCSEDSKPNEIHPIFHCDAPAGGQGRDKN